MLTNRWPPIRFYVGCVLVAAVIVFVEKNARITAGGVGGLAIALYGLTGVSVGVLNILIKLVLFAFVYFIGGARTAVWTIVSTLLIGVCIILFEQWHLPYQMPAWLAFLILVTVAYFPTGILLAVGYSTGGFTSIAQIMLRKYRAPIWVTMLVFNVGVILLMAIAFGGVSGGLSLLATLWQGTAIHFWTQVCKRLFPLHQSIAPDCPSQ